jgi:hypothetical protein
VSFRNVAHVVWFLVWTAKGCDMGSGVDRRSFLGALVGLPAALSAGGDARVRPHAAEAVEVDSFFVAGYQYHEGPAIEARLRPGTRLVARREPANAHDDLAIALLARGVMIGYVPRARNAIPARLIDAGFRVRFTVAVVDRAAPTWERVRVREHVER